MRQMLSDKKTQVEFELEKLMDESIELWLKLNGLKQYPHMKNF